MEKTHEFTLIAKNAAGSTCCVKMQLGRTLAYDIAMSHWMASHASNNLYCLSWKIPISEVGLLIEDGSMVGQVVTSYRCDSFINTKGKASVLELRLAFYTAKSDIVYRCTGVIHIPIDSRGFIIDFDKNVYVQEIIE